MDIEHISPEDIYYTIMDQVRAEIKVKRSKFIATALPVPTKEDAMLQLGTIRTEFHDANHNCFAYRIGHSGMEFRAADAGEPAGSAGKPILFSIKKYNVSDVLVVVTRYFGGTKLGVGGLARAYSDAAELALTQAVKKPIFLTTPIKVYCTYEDVNIVKKLVIIGSVSFEEYYQDAVEYTAQVPNSKVKRFCDQITQSTNARAGTVIQKQ